MDNEIRLKMILADSLVGLVLPDLAHLNLPNWWLAGGSVRNTVWCNLFGDKCALFIKDFDVAFFDPAGDRSQELAAKVTLKASFPNYKFDIKNQVSFGRWRSGSMKYTSAEDGIRNWLHTATAVGVKMDAHGNWQFFTPYGLDDLFAGIIRPTPANIHNLEARRKGKTFLENCPDLKFIEE